MGLTVVAFGASSAAAPDQTLRPQKLGPADPKPRPLIVGGTAITIQQAPWQTYVTSFIGGTGAACGGSIYDADTVVTAAHCVYDDLGVPRPPATFTVDAGISNFVTPASGDSPQSSGVTSIRIHPGYSQAAGPGSPDDVAVLELSAPLALGSATAQPIPLGTAAPAIGSAASLTGFGLQSAGGTPNGQLYALATSLTNPLTCGGPNNALYLCVASAAGSACQGDSGGPMTQSGALVGVASFVEEGCAAGALNGYTNVTAGEISAFIAGDPTPPLAPRGGTDVGGRGVFQVGGSVTCSPGTWTNSPTFTYRIVDTGSGAVLQSGPSPTYTFTAADVGRTVACQVFATTPGGTGIAVTEASPAVIPGEVPAPQPEPQPQPQPEPEPEPARRARLAVSVEAGKRSVKAGRRVGFAIRVTNRGRARARRVVVCSSPSNGLVFGRTPPGAKRSNGRACWVLASLAPRRTRTVAVSSGQARAGRTLRLTLRATRSRRTRTATNTIGARARNARLSRDSARVLVRAVRQQQPPPGVTG